MLRTYTLPDTVRRAFESQVRFRQRSADRFPERAAENMAAAETLSKLATTVSECSIETLKAAFMTGQVWDKAVREIGQGWSPRSCEAFCREVIARAA